jgi:hypothetical protein
LAQIKQQKTKAETQGKVLPPARVPLRIWVVSPPEWVVTLAAEYLLENADFYAKKSDVLRGKRRNLYFQIEEK